MATTMRNVFGEIKVSGRADCLWRYRLAGGKCDVKVSAPVFEIGGRAVAAALTRVREARAPSALGNGVVEHAYEGRFRDAPGLALELVFRVAEDSPVVRFRYALKATEGHSAVLTRSGGADRLSYLALSLAAWPECREVRLSEFDESVHAYRLREQPLEPKEFENGLAVMGPILAATDGRRSLLVAYEHGSQAPDAFLRYHLHGDRRVELRAAKGNYWSGKRVSDGEPHETLWLQLAAAPGGLDDLARRYRAFVLDRLSLNAASRRPYIFYNTWAFQERNKWWNGKKYLDSMTQERMLAEIDVAHRMGIEVFVLDTGWYEKTGDWRVNLARFPDGLQAVREKLDGYGMKLGLWFSPTEAAVTSRMLAEHRDCLMSWRGKESRPHGVWETEDSQCLCLVSRYWEAFADELIRLVREVGVTYFKWDAVGQYGCDDPRHGHGGADVPAQERADAYAFEQVRYMARVVDRLCAACPEAIVDFDITEGGRSVGLAFLSAGKYFLVNNGPYYPNYNVPYDWGTAGTWSNIFVYPGPARGWVCRAPLSLDRWVPSVLFLVHYLPDDPEGSQIVNLASLVLGHNGIWGDLLALSPEGVHRFGRVLGLYRQVREDITRAAPVCAGGPGGSPEIHEKVLAATGRGVVALFASAAGVYEYVTAAPVASTHWATEGVTVARDAQGRARLAARFEKSGAHLVFFGVTA